MPHMSGHLHEHGVLQRLRRRVPVDEVTPPTPAVTEDDLPLSAFYDEHAGDAEEQAGSLDQKAIDALAEDATINFDEVDMYVDPESEKKSGDKPKAS